MPAATVRILPLLRDAATPTKKRVRVVCIFSSLRFRIFERIHRRFLIKFPCGGPALAYFRRRQRARKGGSGGSLSGAPWRRFDTSKHHHQHVRTATRPYVLPSLTRVVVAFFKLSVVVCRSFLRAVTIVTIGSNWNMRHSTQRSGLVERAPCAFATQTHLSTCRHKALRRLGEETEQQLPLGIYCIEFGKKKGGWLCRRLLRAG